MELRTCVWAVLTGAIACGSRVSVGGIGDGHDASGGSAQSTGPQGAGGIGTAGGNSGSATSAGGVAPGGAGGAAGGAGELQDASDCGTIEYPASGFYGDNVLFPSFDHVASAAEAGKVEMAAKLVTPGSLKLKMTLIDGSEWGLSSGGDWRFTNWDFATKSQLFEPKNAGQTSEIQLSFYLSGKALIEYFECSSANPTRTKTLSWGDVDGGGGRSP